MTTWTDLENIMLGEISQTEGQILYDSTYNEVPKTGDFIKTINRRGNLLNGYRFLLVMIQA